MNEETLIRKGQRKTLHLFRESLQQAIFCTVFIQKCRPGFIFQVPCVVGNDRDLAVLVQKDDQMRQLCVGATEEGWQTEKEKMRLGISPRCQRVHRQSTVEFPANGMVIAPKFLISKFIKRVFKSKPPAVWPNGTKVPTRLHR